MKTTLSIFNPQDNSEDYLIKKVDMYLQLIHISTNSLIDFEPLDKHLDSINPAWYEHTITLIDTPFIVLQARMADFICKHNSLMDRIAKDKLEYLAIMN